MKQQNNRIIHLEEMCIYIISQWKKIILVLVCVAVFFGCVGVYKVQKKYSQNEKSDSQVTISKEEQSDVEMMVYLENAIDRISNYCNDSVLMKIDPYKRPICQTIYKITIQKNEDAEEKNLELAQIQRAYQELESDSSLLEEIRKACDSKEEDALIKEIIDIDISTLGLVVININYSDLGTAKKIRTVVEEYLKKNKENIASSFSKYDVQLMNEKEGTCVDLDLRDRQNAQINNLNNYKSTAQAKRPLLSENASQYLTLYRTLADDKKSEIGKPLRKTNTVEKVGIKQKIIQIIKFMVKRVILCFILIVAVLMGIYMWARKLKNGFDLTEMYGIEVVEEVSENNLELILEKVKILLVDQRNTVLISSDIDAIDETLLQIIIEKLNAHIIDVDTSMEILQGEVCVIEIEQLQKSLYSKIDKLIDGLYKYHITIDGSIVIR